MSDPDPLPAISLPLPWQQESWQALLSQWRAHQLPHALLFAGPRDIGKAQLAMALARLLLCHEPVDGHNCGQCQACRLSAGGVHGDFRWLEPSAKSRVIKVDQVREAVAFTGKTAAFGRSKVVVLAPADSMNSNAANALLKALEEPPPDTYLLLVCHRLHGVPATIRSRCQIRKLTLPPRQLALDSLAETAGDRAGQLLDLAEGRPLLARRLLDAGGEHLEAVRAALQGLLSGRVAVPEVASLLADDEVEQVLEWLVAQLQSTLRDLQGQGVASGRGRALFGLLDELATLQRAVAAGANPNRQLLLESLLLRVQRLAA